jgi:hypothetical protein
VSLAMLGAKCGLNTSGVAIVRVIIIHQIQTSGWLASRARANQLE